MIRFEPLFALAGSALDKAFAGADERVRKPLLVAGGVGATMLVARRIRRRRRRQR
jgi:hypothetical protein